jgi:hypothetical protein
MVTAGGILVRGLDQSHTVTEETLEAAVKGGIAAARAVPTAYGRTLRQRSARRCGFLRAARTVRTRRKMR